MCNRRILRLNTNCRCTASFVSLIADALLHDQVIMWLHSSYGDGCEKDSVQCNKQATVATLLSLNLGKYKSQDLSLGFYSY